MTTDNTGMEEFIFSGKVKWLAVREDKYGKYTMCFYPKSDGERKAIKAIGLRNSLNEDDDGFFYRFRTKEGPFTVVDPEGYPVEDVVGNGSEVSIRLEVETFQSPKYGECKRSAVATVVVDKLIPYVPAEKKDELPEE